MNTVYYQQLFMESVPVLFFCEIIFWDHFRAKWEIICGPVQNQSKNVWALLSEVLAFHPNEPVERNQLVSSCSQTILRIHYPSCHRLFFPATRRGLFDQRFFLSSSRFLLAASPGKKITSGPRVRIHPLPSQKLDILSYLHGKQRHSPLSNEPWVHTLSFFFTLYPFPSLGGRIQCVHPWPSSPDGVQGRRRKAGRWVAVVM